MWRKNTRQVGRHVIDKRISSERFSLNVTQWIEFLSDDNNSIHTTQMISLKKYRNQRDLFEDVTIACVRPLNWNPFRHWPKDYRAAKETLYDHFWTRKTSVRTKKNRRHRKVGCHISSISNVLMEITDTGVVRSSETNVLDKSLTHKHLFVSIWVSCKSIICC